MSKILPDGVYIVRDKRLYKVDFYEPIFENCKTVKVEIPNFEVLPMTNADRIRAMSDEELASFLAIEYWKLPKCNSVYGENEECFQPDCTGCWLDWLKEEVEE